MGRVLGWIEHYEEISSQCHRMADPHFGWVLELHREQGSSRGYARVAVNWRGISPSPIRKTGRFETSGFAIEARGNDCRGVYRFTCDGFWTDTAKFLSRLSGTDHKEDKT